MRRHLIAKRWQNSGYVECCLPGVDEPSRSSSEHVGFVPAHQAQASSFSLVTGKIGKRRTINEPATIHVPGNSFGFRYGRCERVRKIDDESAAAIEAIDAEIVALREKLRQTVEEAYRRGTSVTLIEAREWRKET